MADRGKGDETDELGEETTDRGEGDRGVAESGRGGTFRPTPGEGGDREGTSGGPETPIPHREDG